MARKSRVITETQKQESVKTFEWKIGIYIRLSKEDLSFSDSSIIVTIFSNLLEPPIALTFTVNSPSSTTAPAYT